MGVLYLVSYEPPISTSDYCSLLIAPSLLSAHCSLLVAHSSLLVAHSSLIMACCSLLIDHGLLLVACCSLLFLSLFLSFLSSFFLTLFPPFFSSLFLPLFLSSFLRFCAVYGIAENSISFILTVSTISTISSISGSPKLDFALCTLHNARLDMGIEMAMEMKIMRIPDPPRDAEHI